MRVNKELIRNWVKALRSGDYEQSSERLRSDDRFCCLGVLCDVSEIGEWDDDIYEINGIRDVCGLPLPLIEATGLQINCDHFPISKESLEKNDIKSRLSSPTLVDLNDVLNLDFNKIADIIECEFLQEDANTTTEEQ